MIKNCTVWRLPLFVGSGPSPGASVPAKLGLGCDPNPVGPGLLADLTCGLALICLATWIKRVWGFRQNPS